VSRCIIVCERWYGAHCALVLCYMFLSDFESIRRGFVISHTVDTSEVVPNSEHELYCYHQRVIAHLGFPYANVINSNPISMVSCLCIAT
jgi:hypothetical protein